MDTMDRQPESLQLSTPPLTRSSSQTSKGRHSPSLSLDLSDLPGLIYPSPPSNTLLITNLNNPSLFTPEAISIIRTTLQRHCPEPIHTFSPLRSLRRIIVVLPTTEAAIALRTYLESNPDLFTSLLPETSSPTLNSSSEPFTNDSTVPARPVRVYYGADTPIYHENDSKRHLRAPDAQKQFFISPPPSPPVGWESREEEPPNREVHADDLKEALERLGGGVRRVSLDTKMDGMTGQDGEARDVLSAMGSGPMSGSSPTSPVAGSGVWSGKSATRSRSGTLGGRKRSSSVVVFQPPEVDEKTVDSPRLPAVVVEDMTEEPEEVGDEDEEMAEAGMEEVEVNERRGVGLGLGLGMGITKTARPPVELMNDL